MTELCWQAIVQTPLPGNWRLGLRTTDGALAEVQFLPPQIAPRAPRDALARHFAGQLAAYFAGRLGAWEGPLAPAATVYRQQVAAALSAIPAGEVVSYGELAARLGSGARAVAGACRANPLPIVVPCHRVVGRSGLGGYMGGTDGERLDLKRWLLRHEGARRAG